MSLDDKIKAIAEKAVKDDQAKRIVLLYHQQFDIAGIAKAYEMTEEEVKKIIDTNKGGYEWGLGL